MKQQNKEKVVKAKKIRVKPIQLIRIVVKIIIIIRKIKKIFRLMITKRRKKLSKVKFLGFLWSMVVNHKKNKLIVPYSLEIGLSLLI